ncbi:hypothetical protein [Prevotella histicola]|uniref:hypothetical protein n=1 Tax=Prevotella histicola TaxID=470565 RepID=UPI001C5F083B|nr:hypothetical protein [Prevotella histicola]MBW4776881.1 hypothetical protein [Prevotella histicola]
MSRLISNFQIQKKQEAQIIFYNPVALQLVIEKGTIELVGAYLPKAVSVILVHQCGMHKSFVFNLSEDIVFLRGIVLGSNSFLEG